MDVEPRWLSTTLTAHSVTLAHPFEMKERGSTVRYRLSLIHILLLDYLQFEDLGAACEAAGRWEFLCVTAPLRITGGTGSPVNPVSYTHLDVYKRQTHG